MRKAEAYSAASATSPAVPTTMNCREATGRDVQTEFLFSGICHSDLHHFDDECGEFMRTAYPIVPGHQIPGRLTKAGSAVTDFKPGDLAAAGCLIDSDRTCSECQADHE